jgi:hypothetical protein
VALKKPSEYFKKDIPTVSTPVQELVKGPELDTFSDAFESFKNNLSKIEVLSEFSETLDNYRVNVERVNHLSEKVEDIQTEIQTLLSKEDLDRAMMSQLIVVEQSIRDVQSKVKGINEKNILEIKSDVTDLTETVNEFLQTEVPKYKRLVVDSELRTRNKYEELELNVNETLEGIGEFVDKKYGELTETLQGINEQSLSVIIEDFKLLDETVLKFKEEDIPRYKGFIVETERKTESKLETFDQKLNETVDDVLDKINSVETINSSKIKEVHNLQKRVDNELQNIEELTKKVTGLEVEIIRNESHIKSQSKYIENIQEEVRDVISKLSIEQLEEKSHKLGEKIKYLDEVFEKFNEKEILTETLLVEPPSTDNEDSLTPLNKKFVTLDQLQDHYRLFINRIQQQLSTLGGGGETRLKYLDDIVGIATNASAYNDKYLKYNHSIGKFEFSDIKSDDDSWIDGSYGTYTNTNVGIGTSVPQYDLDVNGDINFEGSFYQNGSLFVASRWTAGAGTSIYRDSFVGIGTTTPQYDLDVDGDINFTGTFYQDGSQFVASRWTAGTGNDIYRLNGDVGIGTTNPQAPLDVVGNIKLTGELRGPSNFIIDPEAVGDNTGAVRIKGDLYVDGTQFIVNSTTIELADFNVGIATTVGTNVLLDGAGIGIGSINIRKTITWNNTASALTSSEDWNLVTGKQYEIGGTQVLSSTTIGSGVTNSSLTSVGTLTNLNVAGIVTANDFNSASDIKLKENVSVIDDPLDKIAQLEGVNFQWKENGKKSLGVIAQEVEKVLPELVSGEESKTVNYNGLIGLLIECVKEQQKEIEELKQLINK